MDLDTPIYQVMTRSVVTVTLATPLHEVRRLMTEGAVHHTPVVENGRVVGILSSLDLLRVASTASAVPLQSQGTALTVGTLMSRDVAVVQVDAPVRAAVALFVARRVHALPVVEGDERFVGLVTTQNLVTWLFHG